MEATHSIGMASEISVTFRKLTESRLFSPCAVAGGSLDRTSVRGKHDGPDRPLFIHGGASLSLLEIELLKGLAVQMKLAVGFLHWVDSFR
jgi:hypothetical protein